MTGNTVRWAPWSPRGPARGWPLPLVLVLGLALGVGIYYSLGTRDLDAATRWSTYYVAVAALAVAGGTGALVSWLRGGRGAP